MARAVLTRAVAADVAAVTEVVVAFDPDRDARAFHAVHQEAFAAHWEYMPRDFESWSKFHLESARFDPTLRCVVRAGDEIAAGTICTGDTYGGASDNGAFRLYERAGVAPVLSWVMYEKALGDTT
jgi:hypothetical protein